MTWVLSLLIALQAAPPPAAAPAPIYVPQRVYDTHRQAFGDFESMLADLAKADVIFVGEQHDDPNTHRLEAAILDGLHRRGLQPIVSLEMFERDVQVLLDRYVAGTTTEEEFLKGSRPWPRYATDYRPMVEMARQRGWTMVASNVPRRHASAVAKSGKSALEGLTPEERGWIASDLRCPKDAYFDRFAQSMTGHATPGGDKVAADERQATTERYYVSQCLKDETMAEAIVAAFGRGSGPVVHVNGAFHSDFGQGTLDRVRRRLDGRRVAGVTVLPVKDIDKVAPTAEDLRRADYVIYTVK
jgi:uncharacterized iron-regulated protein